METNDERSTPESRMPGFREEPYFDVIGYIHKMEKAVSAREQAEIQAEAYSAAFRRLIARQDEKTIRELATKADLIAMEARLRESQLALESRIRELEIKTDADITKNRDELAASIDKCELRLREMIAETKTSLIKWGCGVAFASITIVLTAFGVVTAWLISRLPPV